MILLLGNIIKGLNSAWGWSLKAESLHQHRAHGMNLGAGGLKFEFMQSDLINKFKIRPEAYKIIDLFARPGGLGGDFSKIMVDENIVFDIFVYHRKEKICPCYSYPKKFYATV